VGGEYIVFWLLVGLGVVMMVGMYCGFSALAGGSGTTLDQIIERKDAEYQLYAKNNVVCGKVALDSGLGFMGTTPKITIRVKNKIEVLARTGISQGLTEITLKGKLDGQLVTFWLRERYQDVDNPIPTETFILYLRGSGPYADFTKEESLLAGSEFGLIIPYLPSRSESVLSSSSSYGNSPVTFQAYVLNEISSVLDYITVTYNSPQIIAYGEAWGSVLARELGIIDDRIDLVITNKFPGDPYETISTNGYYSLIGLENRLYVKDADGCLPTSVGSFGRLMPTYHVYVGSSIYNSFYSLGTRRLAGFIEERYLDAGIPEKFTYIELEDLNATYNEKILEIIHLSLKSDVLSD